MGHFSRRGQATIEFLFVLILTVALSVKMVKGITNVMADSIGSLGSVLSQHLSTGVCPNECLFRGYGNGPEVL